ncbi:MAG: L-seryl-tRNA(Sec) selenium transferase [Firmicutes bacterium HGW-Firmicutes-14]|nr:MAG: L-seryl-tRNA(Sec) selenium transferase [Firmicutes bacterium HGW-Firmicutes-14]
MDTKNSLLRKLPAISSILEEEQINRLREFHPYSIISEAASEVVQAVRERILENKKPDPVNFDLQTIIGMVVKRVREKTSPSLCKVVNGTGIVLHTNLGRAVLAREAVDAINEVAGSYSNLEVNLETGERGTRYSHIEELLCRLTGAEAGLVVNNNAAAVLLVLSTMARGREVIVSRGQLVEIGGSFRIPDVMAQSGAVLKEVGTTNKTHLWDYERAVSEETALLLKVHTSNYKIIGFTSEVSVEDLAALGRKRSLPVFEDIGSGVLVDFTKYGLNHEPTVRESIEAGVDVVTCSGDKLFGGPQAGIIAGRKDIIERIKKNPLTRALRIDKFTLAAMEATLRIYFDEEKAVREIPTLRMITMPLSELRTRAEKLAAVIRQRLGDAPDIEIIQGFSQVGGGSLPEENIPTFHVALSLPEISVSSLEQQLRTQEPPVLARIQKDRLLFDPRTLLDGDEALIAGHLAAIAGHPDKMSGHPAKTAGRGD